MSCPIHRCQRSTSISSVRVQYLVSTRSLRSRMVELEFELESRLANQRTSGQRFSLAHRRAIVQLEPILVFIPDIDIDIIVSFQPPILNPSLINSAIRRRSRCRCNQAFAFTFMFAALAFQVLMRNYGRNAHKQSVVCSILYIIHRPPHDSGIN